MMGVPKFCQSEEGDIKTLLIITASPPPSPPSLPWEHPGFIDENCKASGPVQYWFLNNLLGSFSFQFNMYPSHKHIAIGLGLGGIVYNYFLLY